MWPWEHIAFSYLGYSGLSHASGNGSPGHWATIITVVASLLPDIVDKPLAWGIGVLPAGRSLGHSLLVAIPVILVIYAVSWRLKRGPIATPLAVGYLSHLAGDVIYPLVVKREFRAGFLFWPLRPAESDNGPPQALLGHVMEVLRDFAAFLMTTPGLAYLYIELLALLFAMFVWLNDGAPGPGVLRKFYR